ncbi:MAG: trimeric intracellular cation channel family protein [Tannerella sp.]|uniref:trimeric intracellular cation channel family protein n=1 Tax=Tannerella sp. TaxID=2382127 RepID=UPI003FA2D50D
MEPLQDYASLFSLRDIIEYAGTIVFAISGIRLAAAKEFDWFGAFVVGLVTAIGGGTLRDLLLGITPFWMLSPSYMYCTLLGMVIVFIFSKQLVRLDTPFFIFDAIGLALFVVIGIEKTLELNYPFWVAITMGTITGIAGGVVRDIFINETPLVFRQEVYALACVMGGIVFAVCHTLAYSNEACELLSSATILLIRVLAVKYHWKLPKMKH